MGGLICHWTRSSAAGDQPGRDLMDYSSFFFISQTSLWSQSKQLEPRHPLSSLGGFNNNPHSNSIAWKQLLSFSGAFQNILWKRISPAGTIALPLFCLALTEMTKNSIVSKLISGSLGAGGRGGGFLLELRFKPQPHSRRQLWDPLILGSIAHK